MKMLKEHISVVSLVFLPVGREMLEEGEQVPHDDEDGPRPGLDQLPDLDHELVLGLQLCQEECLLECYFDFMISSSMIAFMSLVFLINYHGWSDCV